MKNGIDTATRITAAVAAQLVKDGYTFVLRYLAPNEQKYRCKRLTQPEAQIISDAGLLIGAVYETSAGRPKGGAPYGTTDGKAALASAAENNIPDSGCIYFAVDFGAGVDDYDAIEAYLRAAKEQIGNHPIGVYGSYFTVEEMHRRGVCDYYWQCVGWSGGKQPVHANLYQHTWDKHYAGITVDFDYMYSDAGLWNYNMESEDDDMDGKEIYEKLNEYLRELPAPDWAQAELQEAVDAGITDGTRPCELVPRYQAAIMAKRAAQK